MARRKSKKNPYIGSSLNEWLAEERKDPEFAAEFDRLELSHRLRDLRVKRKLTQGQLAAEVGTKQPAIARLESGTVVPKLGLLQKVARALGTRLDVRFVG